MPRFERAELLKKFRAMVARGEPIIGGGAGTGLSAKCEEAGGIDLIVLYNSGRYRMGWRCAARLQEAPRACRRKRHRSVPRHGRIPPSVEGAGFRRRTEFSDRRT